MAIDDADLAAQLHAAVLSGDTAHVSSIAQTIDRRVFDAASFPPRLFDKALFVLRTPEFRQLDDGARLLEIFEYNLDLLTNSQKEELMHALEECVSDLTDWLAAFLAMELIAEIWRDERSLEVLQRLMSGTATEQMVALIVHGLDWLAKEANRRDVKELCLDELRRAARHSSGLVRAEAVAAIKRRTV